MTRGFLVAPSLALLIAVGVGLSIKTDTITPAAATAYGSGCGAAGATIATTLTPFGMPVTGNAAFELDVRAAATQSPVLIAFGASQTQIPLGAGCDLLLQGSFGALFGLTDAQGLWHLPLPMPANLALRGYPFVAQAAVTDASAPLGFALTQGLQLVVGD